MTHEKRHQLHIGLVPCEPRFHYAIEPAHRMKNYGTQKVCPPLHNQNRNRQCFLWLLPSVNSGITVGTREKENNPADGGGEAGEDGFIQLGVQA